MENHSESRETRRHQIAGRLAAIRARINDLQQPRESRLAATSIDQVGQARHHAADSEAAVQQALASSIQGLLQAARAHERCSVSYERLAAARDSNEEHYRQWAARHRAAAAADRQRAERAQSLLSGRAGNRPGTAGNATSASQR